MAAYRRVYDSLHLQADCQGPGSAPEPYARQSLSLGYLYLFFVLELTGAGQQGRSMLSTVCFALWRAGLCGVYDGSRSNDVHWRNGSVMHRAVARDRAVTRDRPPARRRFTTRPQPTQFVRHWRSGSLVVLFAAEMIIIRARSGGK